jgi:hypothetical protein
LYSPGMLPAGMLHYPRYGAVPLLLLLLLLLP